MKYCLLILVVLIPAIMPARAQTSMFADPKARQRGDMLMIILAERTVASRESNWQNSSNSKLGGASNVTANDDAAKSFALDASFNKDASSANESVQNDLLSGTMTATVVGADSLGNLLIAGERKLHVNGETHIMRVKGSIRPFDIRSDNSVFSYQIAGADIEYRRAGLGGKFFKPAKLARLGALALAGVGIFLAAGQ